MADKHEQNEHIVQGIAVKHEQNAHIVQVWQINTNKMRTLYRV